jgi:hypothetical protein
MAATKLSRTLGSGSATNKFTYSTWLKYSGWVAGGQRWFSTVGTGDTYFRFNEDGTMEVSGHNSAASSAGYFITNRVFDDHASWYHIVIRFDSTESSASNRLRLYINGVQEESFSTYTDVNQNATDNINLSGNTQIIGGTSSSQYFNGLMAQTILSIGYSYDPTTFGEVDSTSGEWKPLPNPSLSYGTNGFNLSYETSSALGDDTSGNTNDFTLSGSGTQTLDSSSNNFATLNTLVGDVAGGYTIINGNLSVTANTGDAWRTMYGTIAASKGKFYFEQKIDNASGTSHYVGASEVENMEQTNTNGFENTATSAYCYRPDGGKVSKNVLTAGWGDSWTAGDIIGTAIDIDNLKIYFSKNGVWQASGDPTSGSTGTGAAYTIDAGKTYTAATATYNTQNDYSYNFGNGYFGTTAVSSAGTPGSTVGTFEYDVPTGYQPLSTKGLNA